jgi:hypothetical protein
MSPTVRSVIIGFVVLLVVFRCLELLRPSHQRLPVLRRGFWTDLGYWGFTPLVTRAVTGLGVAIVAIPIAHAIYGTFDRSRSPASFRF